MVYSDHEINYPPVILQKSWKSADLPAKLKIQRRVPQLNKATEGAQKTPSNTSAATVHTPQSYPECLHYLLF